MTLSSSSGNNSTTIGPWSSWRRHLVPCILSLPNELLFEVVSYLAPRDTSSFMSTCRRISYVAAYNRYTSLIVGPRHGYRLVTALLSGTEVSNIYCSMVKRLWFRGWTYQRYTYENASLFCNLLPYLKNLMSLWIEASPSDSIHLVKTMKRAGLIREEVHPAQCLLDIETKGSCFSARTLPNLRFLKLSGDVSLSELASFRTLAELEINITLNHAGFSKFASSVQDSVLGNNLKNLTIKLSQTVDSMLAFPIIANACSQLERLSIEQTGVKFEGIVELMAAIPSMLPRMVYMVVNCLYAHPLGGSYEDSNGNESPKPDSDRMMRLVERTFASRRDLRTLGLGQAVWVIGMYGYIRKHMVVHQGPRFWSSKFGTQSKAQLFSPYFMPSAYLTYS